MTPWAWCIKEGTEPWKGEIGFYCLMSKLPHHTPGVSVARSLALLALSSHDLWTQIEVKIMWAIARSILYKGTSLAIVLKSTVVGSDKLLSEDMIECRPEKVPGKILTNEKCFG